MAGYYGALRDFYASRGWRPDAAGTDLGAFPRPPPDGSLALAADFVAERCHLVRPVDGTVTG